MWESLAIVTFLAIIFLAAFVSERRAHRDTKSRLEVQQKLRMQASERAAKALEMNATLSWPAVALGWVSANPCGRTVRKFLRLAGDVGPQKAIEEYRQVIQKFALEANKCQSQQSS